MYWYSHREAKEQEQRFLRRSYEKKRSGQPCHHNVSAWHLRRDDDSLYYFHRGAVWSLDFAVLDSGLMMMAFEMEMNSGRGWTKVEPVVEVADKEVDCRVRWTETSPQPKLESA